MPYINIENHDDISGTYYKTDKPLDTSQKVWRYFTNDKLGFIFYKKGVQLDLETPKKIEYSKFLTRRPDPPPTKARQEVRP